MPGWMHLDFVYIPACCSELENAFYVGIFMRSGFKFCLYAWAAAFRFLSIFLHGGWIYIYACNPICNKQIVFVCNPICNKQIVYVCNPILYGIEIVW